MSFYTDKIITEGISYNEVILAPAYSKTSPEKTTLCSRFSRNISLNIPLVSAGHYTVTESAMAIAMAHLGGLGIVHEHASVDDQVREIEIVKQHHDGLNANPACLNQNRKIADVLPFIQRKKLKEIPVVDNLKKLIGMVSREDLKTIADKNRKLSDIVRNQECVYTTTPVNFEAASALLKKHKKLNLPIVDNDQQLVALYSDVSESYPMTLCDQAGKLMVAAMVSASPRALSQIERLVDAGANAIVLNAVHAHSRQVLELLRKAKSQFGTIDFVAGNVSTAEAATDLALAGADGITIDLNPEERWSYTQQTGVGISSLPALYEVSKALTESGIPVIANDPGGFPGNLVKVLAAGAEAVCLDQLICGTEESPGKTIWVNGKKFKWTRPLHQTANNTDAAPQTTNYRRDGQGSLQQVINHLTNCLRNGMCLCGAENIEELQQARFIRLSGQESSAILSLSLPENKFK